MHEWIFGLCKNFISSSFFVWCESLSLLLSPWKQCTFFFLLPLLFNLCAAAVLFRKLTSIFIISIYLGFFKAKFEDCGSTSVYNLPIQWNCRNWFHPHLQNYAKICCAIFEKRVGCFWSTIIHSSAMDWWKPGRVVCRSWVTPACDKRFHAS